jgi:hypothetical protein
VLHSSGMPSVEGTPVAHLVFRVNGLDGCLG